MTAEELRKEFQDKKPWGPTFKGLLIWIEGNRDRKVLSRLDGTVG